jgi:hypothetical protein
MGRQRAHRHSNDDQHDEQNHGRPLRLPAGVARAVPLWIYCQIRYLETKRAGDVKGLAFNGGDVKAES